jgi:hypothetical protein
MVTGRPKVSIDWKKVDKLLEAGANGVSIASVIGVCPDTIYRMCEKKWKMTFSAYAQSKRAVGLDMLKVKQYQTAMQGDKTMLVWLGKQYLGQSDKMESKEVVRTETHDLSKLTDEEVLMLDALYSKASS